MAKSGWVLYWQKSPRGMAAARKAAMPEVLQGIGQYWHRYRLPVHFSGSAWSEYSEVYKRRGFRYWRRKIQKTGQALPLVYTGALRSAVSSSVLLRAGEKRVEIRMRGPRWLAGYLRFRGRRGTGPDMHKELTVISRHEAEEFARRLRKELGKAIQNAKG